MKKLLLWVVLASMVLATKSFAIFSANVSGPGTVNVNDGFYIYASGSDDFAEIDMLTLYGPSGYISSVYPDSWNRSNVSLNAYQTAPGSPTTLGYTAYLDTDYSSTSASTGVNVVSTNQAPTINWVTNPGSVQVGQNFTVQARGNDADGNLTNVQVWREWTPFAFNGGGNGYENTSDGNGYSQGTPGTVTFQAQATDNNGAQSAVIFWTVNIYNNAPTIEWNTVSSSAYVNQYFIMRAHGHDNDGNLSSVSVWREVAPNSYVPFALDGGGNGYDSITDNNGMTPTVPGSVHFTAQASDSAGATTGVIDAYVTIVNRAPTNPTITPSGPVYSLGNGQYYCWLDEVAVTPITLTATLHDDDGNLVNHYVSYQKVPLGSSPTAGGWTHFGSETPSNGTDSTIVRTHSPNTTGRWDYNMGGHDGYISTPGASVTIYVYGPTNGATFSGQSVDTSPMAVGTTRNVSVMYQNTGDKPWTTDGTPHMLGSASATNWGVTRIGLATGETIGLGEFKTFAFTITAPATPGVYDFKWQMVEEGLEWFGNQSTNLTINVVDTTSPTTPIGLSASAVTHNSFTLNWAASLDNVGVTGYEVMRDATSIGTTAATNAFVGSLTPNTTYVMKVRARDSTGNWSAWSAPLSVTTTLDPNADQDGDGIPNGWPNGWESSHGLNPNSNDALLDPDGDGLSNIAEYNLNKNPQVYDQGTSALGGAVPAGWPSAGGSSTYAVGATTGTLDVDKSGAATYSVPLWITPGTSGLQPQLSLNYSSQGGVGISGFGWSLGGASAITRGPKTLAIDGINKGVTVTSDDRFYLDGQRLIAINGGTYGASGTEYRTELDSFTKVISYGAAGSGPAYFQAWTKAGLIIEFGNTADSAFDAYGKSEKLGWGVNKVSDTKGNYMTFVYTEDAANGVQRLDRINYTGNAGAGLTPYASVRFEYEDRPDWTSGYVAGSPVSNLKRLKYIRSYLGETVARTYTFNYRDNSGTTQQYRDRSVLASLTETASDNRSFPPLTFDYAANELGWESVPAFTPPYFMADNSNSVRPAGSGYMDLNGDGRVDFVVRRDTSGVANVNGAYLNTGSGWNSAPAYQLPYKMADTSTALDQGGRFVDLDGDGLVDYVWYLKGAGGNTIASGAYLNTGSGWTSSPGWIPPAPIAKDDRPLNSAKFIDVNGDGRPDYVSYMDTGGNPTNLTVYLNTGSGWSYSAAYSSSITHNLATAKASFVDLNGDDLPDIVASYNGSGTFIQCAYLNTGNGWVYTSAYLPPQLMADNINANLGAEFADVNGDGLPDMIWYRETGGSYQRGVALNTGSGWLTSGSVQGESIFDRYAPTLSLGRDGVFNAGSALIDLNADGMVDAVRSQQPDSNPAAFSVHYGTGREWNYAGAGAAHEVSMVLLMQGGITQTGVDFVDFDSDGVPDLIWSRKHADGSSFSGAWRNKSKPTNDRLIKVTNGMGVAAQITYASLLEIDGSGYPTVYDKGTGGPAGSVNVTGPTQVVKTISHDDGVGGQYVLNYRYGGMRADLIHGNLGFEWMKVTDSRTAIASKTTFKQEYPFIGMLAASETRTASNVLLSESSITYSSKALNGGATVFQYASESLQKSYELNGGGLVSQIKTTTAYNNDYGNATSVTVDSLDGFKKETTNVYGQDNVTNWFLGRLTSSTVSAYAPSKPALNHSSSFTYDLGTGLLLTETVEPGNSALSVTTTYGYDAYGNKGSVTLSGSGVSNRTTLTSYDGQGRFPASSTNALGHTENYTYDSLLGVMTSLTGPNVLATSWTYDSFGSKTQETRADSTLTQIRVKWAGSGAPGGARYQIETEATGSPPTIVYYDSFGRAFRSLAINGNGQIVYQDTDYDNMSRAYATSVPYRNDGQAVYWTRTVSYDLLSRPLETRTPDDQVVGGYAATTFSYNGLITSATDTKGRTSITIKNSQGWTTSNTRNQTVGTGANDYTTVSYDYDAYGNLISTAAAGVITSIAYDILGRKISMVDPDMGTWSYNYNIFGELISQTDAKNQTSTLSYDTLGRLVTRVELEGTTTWTYDTAPKGSSMWKGKLHTVSSPGGYVEAYNYDSLGRLSTLTRTIDGSSYAFGTTYDSVGRVVKTLYPTVNGGNFTTRNVYNGFGYLKEIRGDSSNKLYWQADSYNIDGRVDGETYGNGLANDRVYSKATGRLLSSGIDRGRVTGAPYQIQQMTYTYDTVGNVLTRADAAVGRGESFEYDGLDRLTKHNVTTGVGGTVTVTYNQLGNITSKSDAATTYTYDATRKHAVTGVSGGGLGSQTFSYDNDGNMTGGYGRTITWTSFNQVASVVKGAYSSIFNFGASHERVKQISHLETTIYVGALFEKVTPAGASPITEYRHYIMAPTGRVAVYTDRSTMTRDTKYYHTDGLGSITAVTDEKGVIVKRFAFDAWGKRLDPSTGTTITGTTRGGVSRGYTDHEQLDDLGLVHMNGRIYEVLLGRFLSADPNVDGAHDAQGYNRYSYVGNNPMNAIDPSGYFKLKDLFMLTHYSNPAYWISPNLYKQVEPAVRGIVVTAILTYASWGIGAPLASAAGGAITSFESSLLNGGSVGDSLKSGIIGGAVGFVGGYIGANVGGSFFAKAAINSVVGGLSAEAQGGEFRHGFYASLAGSAAGLLPSTNNWYGDLITHAAAGGTASAIGGGKFANGAFTAAFQYIVSNSGSRQDNAVDGSSDAFILSRKDVDLSKFTKIGTLYVNDEEAYNTAKSNLIAKSPQTAEYFELLESNKVSIILNVNSANVANFDYHEMIINWDPTSATLMKDNTIQPGIMKLIHEVAHLYDYTKDPVGYKQRLGMNGGVYGDMVEKSIITGIESSVAKAMNYQIRATHESYDSYHAKDMFSTKYYEK